MWLRGSGVAPHGLRKIIQRFSVPAQSAQSHSHIIVWRKLTGIQPYGFGAVCHRFGVVAQLSEGQSHVGMRFWLLWSNLQCPPKVVRGLCHATAPNEDGS